jgi:hypothetical protein
MITKRCTCCGEEKGESEFRTTGKLKLNGDKRKPSWCKTCAYKCTVKWQKKNPEKKKLASKKWRIKNRFTKPLYQSWYDGKKKGYMGCTATPQELEESFTGKCAVCGILESECKRKLHVDHCHKTGKFRGFICNRCNKVLGYMNDSSELLEKAVLYLKLI